MNRLFLIFVLAAVIIVSSGSFAVSRAQDEIKNHPWYVYTRRDAADNAMRELIFMDMLTGEAQIVDTYGTRFTIAGQSVIYWDSRLNRVRVATPDGQVSDHPFIQAEGGAYRVDWVYAPDGKHVAWTQSFRDAAGQLSTVTRFALADGSSLREVLRDGPRGDGLRVLPVAFDSSLRRLFMDYHPDGLSDLTAFPQYAGLFALDLEQGSTAFLPGEPGSFTGAGFGAGFFVRLTLTEDQTGFDVRVENLDTGLSRDIEALRLRGYTQAGDILVSPNGRYAVYSLASISGFGSSRQEVNTVFVLIDLVSMEQTPLTDPITTFVRPTAWTEDNSAVIFTSPQLDGTWKVTLQERALEKIAEPTFRGMLQLNEEF